MHFYRTKTEQYINYIYDDEIGETELAFAAVHRRDVMDILFYIQLIINFLSEKYVHIIYSAEKRIAILQRAILYKKNQSVFSINNCHAYKSNQKAA